MISVAVCVPTYRRPEFVRALLESLTRLRPGEFATRVIVVDNDASGSARPVVQEFVEALPGLIYEIEPERGIASARNRLVVIANRVGADYIALVDDDEWVEPSWLAELVASMRRYAADVVQGPVRRECESDSCRWLVEGGFFSSPPRRSGERIRYFATNNVLIARSTLNRLEGPFDRRFDLTGGEDTHLAERLFRLNARMVWCNEAVVHERITASRGNVRWLLRRRFRLGLTLSRCVRMVEPTPSRCATRTAKFLGRFGFAAIALLPSVFLGRRSVVRVLAHGAFGLGGVLGMIGFTYMEYREIHGR
jgi:succinoglycan biosynthesis protein ExoM